MKKTFFLFIPIILVFIIAFSGCQKAPQQTIIKWEYKISSVSDITFTEEMNKLGSEGWELVFARRAQNSEKEFSYEMIFKRPKLDNEPKTK